MRLHKVRYNDNNPNSLFCSVAILPLGGAATENWQMIITQKRKMGEQEGIHVDKTSYNHYIM